MSKLFTLGWASALLITAGFSYAIDKTISYSVVDKDGNPLPDYVVPSDTDIPNEPNADQIFYGKRLLNETKALMPDKVGSHMKTAAMLSKGKSLMARLTLIL